MADSYRMRPMPLALGTPSFGGGTVNPGSILLIATLALALTACNEALAPIGPQEAERLLQPATVADVTNDLDAGPGSFRAAVEAANADPSITLIRFQPGIGAIDLSSAVTYSGAQSLRIDGRGVILGGTAGCACDLLVANGGADLTLEDLTLENAPRNGVVVDVPASTTGDIGVALREVMIRNNGLHGVLVDDQAGDDGTGGDSEAGILLVIAASAVTGNGFRPGFSDFDGIRIDEGGSGDLYATIHGSIFVGNAGDGVELDERGPGSATAEVRQTSFDDNGEQPQNPDDLEDGFDVDEADEGGISARIVHATAGGNFDEGIDLDEEGPGGIRLVMTQVVASGNVDEGIKLTEDEVSEAGGDMEVDFRNVIASSSRDDDGIHLEEFGPGDVNARLAHSTFDGNDGDGINVDQEGEGGGVLRLQSVQTEGNGDDPVDASGVEVVQVP